MPRTNEELNKCMGLSMVSGMTQIGLDLAKKSSRKTLSYTPSRREVCPRCERSRIWISESMIEDIENTECVIESPTMAMEDPLVTSSSLLSS